MRVCVCMCECACAAYVCVRECACVSVCVFLKAFLCMIGVVRYHMKPVPVEVNYYQ